MTEFNAAIKKSNRVLDVYLFINLIDNTCQKYAVDIVTYMESLPMKSYFHFMPFHNLQTIDAFLKKYQLPCNDLALRNRIYEASYMVALTYKAALAQGKKKANAFLFELQKTQSYTDFDWSSQRIIAAAQKAQLDMPMLLEDRQSVQVKDAYRRDQKLAAKMAVTTTPSVVIFDSNQANGILLTQDISLERLIQALNTNLAQAK